MYESTSRINLYELINWGLFIFFLEYIFPFLLDPLGLSVEIMGYDYGELFEIITLILIPAVLMYITNTVSVESYFFAILGYLLLGSLGLFGLFWFVFKSYIHLSFVFLLIIENSVVFDDEGFIDDGDSSDDYFK